MSDDRVAIDFARAPRTAPPPPGFQRGALKAGMGGCALDALLTPLIHDAHADHVFVISLVPDHSKAPAGGTIETTAAVHAITTPATPRPAVHIVLPFRFLPYTDLAPAILARPDTRPAGPGAGHDAGRADHVPPIADETTARLRVVATQLTAVSFAAIVCSTAQPSASVLSKAGSAGDDPAARPAGTSALRGQLRFCRGRQAGLAD
jgi:hypothetical protein